MQIWLDHIKSFLFNPIQPGVWKPCLARGGASEAPRVKSHHSGLPDGPMPYNDNNMLCLGINKPSYVVFHVIGVCQKGKKVGAMTMDEK